MLAFLSSLFGIVGWFHSNLNSKLDSWRTGGGMPSSMLELDLGVER